MERGRLLHCTNSSTSSAIPIPAPRVLSSSMAKPIPRSLGKENSCCIPACSCSKGVRDRTLTILLLYHAGAELCPNYSRGSFTTYISSAVPAQTNDTLFYLITLTLIRGPFCYHESRTPEYMLARRLFRTRCPFSSTSTTRMASMPR